MHSIMSTYLVGLHCGACGVDWQLRQAYNVSVVLAPCERWY